MHVRAIEYIAPGTELCITYHDLVVPSFQRREELMRSHQFDALQMPQVCSQICLVLEIKCAWLDIMVFLCSHDFVLSSSIGTMVVLNLQYRRIPKGRLSNA
jgi:hypothetical protein